MKTNSNSTPARYGLPYQGSKNGIARWIVDHLPPADVLVDAFAGGCAITHAALLSGKWRRVIANDITDAPQLFADAIAGKYRDERRWIDRETFHALKDSDPYVRLCWSFNNNGECYLYGLNIEAYKKGYHYAAVFDDYSLWEEMGIHVPAAVQEQGHALDSHARRRHIARWVQANNDAVQRAVKEAWLLHIDARRERWQDLLNEIIDKKKIAAEEERLRAYLVAALKESGLTQAEVDRRLGTQMSSHYFAHSQWAFPTAAEYEKMQAFLPLREDYGEVIRFYTVLKDLESLQSLQDLESLQRLQSLESLQRLERHVPRLTIVRGDYAALPLPTGETYTLYCDPPYANTNCGHYGGFDHARFYQWLLSLNHVAYISEYAMPDGFVQVAAREKRVGCSGQGLKCKATERLFVQKHYAASALPTTLFG